MATLLMVREITTKTERITLEESGIINCRVLENTMLDANDARENVEAVRLLGNGARLPVLVDITRSKGITREARAYLAGEHTAKYQSACALIVDSPLSRLIGNFFLGLNRTKFPIRLFHEQEKAVEWLKTFL